MDAFIRGMARIVDLFSAAQSPEVERILSTTDADAIRSDWQAVGDDMWWAIREYEQYRPALPRESRR